MIQAVIFDLDGTLLYTLADIADAANRALKKYGFPGYTEEAYREMVGYGLKDLVRRAVMGHDIAREACGRDSLLDEIYQTLLKEYQEFPVVKTVLYPGIRAMIDALHDRGIKCAVLSNKEDALVSVIVNALFLPSDFTIVQGQRSDTPAKPDPEAVFSILSLLGIPKEQTVFIGDSGADMHTAKNADVLAVGVSWGYRDVEHLRTEGADYIAFSPADIVHFIQGA